MRFNPTLLLVVPISIALTACVGMPAASRAPATHAAETHTVGAPLLTSQGAWRVVSAQDAKGQSLLPTGSNYRLQFADQQLTIHGGCNRMFGGYRVDRDMLLIEPLASTRIACAPERMAQDIAISDLLSPKPLGISITSSQPLQLKLITHAGDILRLDAMPLE